MLQKHKRDILACLCAVLAGIFIYRTRDAWLQIIAVLGLSVLFALMLSPLCTRLERKGLSKNKASICAVLIFVCVLVLFLLVFVPYLLSQAFALIRKMTPTFSYLLEHASPLLSQLGYKGELSRNLPQVVISAIAPLTTGIAKGGAAVISVAGSLVMSLVILYYLLTVRREAGLHLLLCVPTGHRKLFLSVMSGCRNAILGYLSGMIKTCVFVGGATCVSLLLLGVKEALILGVFMGLFEVLPYIGPFLGMLPILLSVLPMGAMKTLIAVCIVLLIQQAESGIIGPYFTSSSTSIHPLAAILSVFIGGILFGLPGVLFSVPLVVVARSVLWSIRNASIQTES